MMRDYELYSRRRLAVRKHKYPWRIWAYGFWLADVLPDSLGFPLFGVLTFGSAGLGLGALLGLFWLGDTHREFFWLILGMLLTVVLRFLGRLGRALVREALRAEQYYRRDDDADE